MGSAHRGLRNRRVPALSLRALRAETRGSARSSSVRVLPRGTTDSGGDSVAAAALYRNRQSHIGGADGECPCRCAQRRSMGSYDEPEAAVLVVVGVGAADADGGDLDQHLSRSRFGNGPVFEDDFARSGEDRCAVVPLRPVVLASIRVGSRPSGQVPQHRGVLEEKAIHQLATTREQIDHRLSLSHRLGSPDRAMRFPTQQGVDRRFGHRLIMARRSELLKVPHAVSDAAAACGLAPMPDGCRFPFVQAILALRAARRASPDCDGTGRGRPCECCRGPGAKPRGSP